MPPTGLNGEEVDRRIDRLRERFGDVPVEDHRETATTGEHPELVAEAEDGYVGGGYTWIVREPAAAPPLSDSMPDGATEDEPVALLILPRGTDVCHWGVPGGTVEDGETYEEAAVREVREETGIECSITDCRFLRRVVVEFTDVEREVHLCYAFFEGSYEGGSLDLQQGELRGAAWFADRPPSVHPTNERLAEAFWGELGEE